MDRPPAFPSSRAPQPPRPAACCCHLPSPSDAHCSVRLDHSNHKRALVLADDTCKCAFGIITYYTDVRRDCHGVPSSVLLFQYLSHFYLIECKALKPRYRVLIFISPVIPNAVRFRSMIGQLQRQHSDSSIDCRLIESLQRNQFKKEYLVLLSRLLLPRLVFKLWQGRGKPHGCLGRPDREIAPRDCICHGVCRTKGNNYPSARQFNTALTGSHVFRLIKH